MMMIDDDDDDGWIVGVTPDQRWSVSVGEEMMMMTSRSLRRVKRAEPNQSKLNVTSHRLEFKDE